jgi:hypothetical protein
MLPDADVVLEPPERNPATNAQTLVVPDRQSCPIEVEGIFLGITVKHRLGVQFIAMDRRVTDMDRSIWPTTEFARTSARQLFRGNRPGRPA